jgi:hypothetical protein
MVTVSIQWRYPTGVRHASRCGTVGEKSARKRAQLTVSGIHSIDGNEGVEAACLNRIGRRVTN